jgi:hypothetical protein
MAGRGAYSANHYHAISRSVNRMMALAMVLPAAPRGSAPNAALPYPAGKRSRRSPRSWRRSWP